MPGQWKAFLAFYAGGVPSCHATAATLHACCSSSSALPQHRWIGSLTVKHACRLLDGAELCAAAALLGRAGDGARV